MFISMINYYEKIKNSVTFNEENTQNKKDHFCD